MLHVKARLLAAALAATAVGTAHAPAGAAPPVRVAEASATAGNVLTVWAPKYMDRSPKTTKAEAIADARHFDFIIAQTSSYGGYVADMRAANPRLQLLAYENATMSTSPTAYPDTWYLKGSDGRKVKTLHWGNYAMNPAEPGWIKTRVSLCRRLLAESGFDGCHLDVIGVSVVVAGFTDQLPINPATGRHYTLNEYLAATGNLAARVRSAVAPKLVYGNNLGDGTSYADPAGPTSQLFASVDGAQSEGFVRVGRSPLTPYPTQAEWKADVDMVVDTAAHGWRLLTTTKVWAPGSQAEKDAWHKFALASFLVGAEGGARFYFTYDEASEPTTYSPWWDTDLGVPSSSYMRRADGVYLREFARGRVYVNPTRRTRTIELRGTFTTLTGQRVTSLTLGPSSAEVLTGPA